MRGMTIAANIVGKLGGPTKLHRETGIPVQTIWDWTRKGNIPHWRRPAVIEAAKKLPEPLPAELPAKSFAER
jgi:hypothetical protein